MLTFKNLVTGEEFSHVEFVKFVWEEAERQFNECYTKTNWCNLTKEELIEFYCEQYEVQLKNGNWTINEK